MFALNSFLSEILSPLTPFLPVKVDSTNLLLAFPLQMKFHGLVLKKLLLLIQNNIRQR